MIGKTAIIDHNSCGLRAVLHRPMDRRPLSWFVRENGEEGLAGIQGCSQRHSSSQGGGQTIIMQG
jgi:hypothetical protein